MGRFDLVKCLPMNGKETVITNSSLHLQHVLLSFKLVFQSFMIHYFHGFEYKFKTLKLYLLVIEAAGPVYREQYNRIQ